MRDLDQLRERSAETTGRKLGLFALAGVVSVAAIIAIGVVDSGSSDRELSTAEDPLVQLAMSGADPKAPAKTPSGVRASSIELGSLSFPATLAGEESAIEATVRSAGAEYAAVTARAPSRLAQRERAAHAPASTLATQHAHLARVAKHDPLVAQALPERSANVAPQGSDGAYTLQVVSYETRDAAERFVGALRARGHRAFVVTAELPGRPRSYRVRIGPFSTRREATEYQTRFEQSERMHTLVVTSAQ